ncbi:MAG: ATP-binding cassette domain-containing protein [Clostridia bacterium]|nr:ATP-binding cassette domain-containing protein [Clostridia bacterium]
MLYLDNVWKAYGSGKNRQAVLRDITLCFRESGLVFVAGDYEYGKSTLLDIIGGYRYPTCGHVYMDGRRTEKYGAFRMDRYRRTCCGYLFNDFQPIAECTIGEAVSDAFRIQQGKDLGREDVEACLARAHLADDSGSLYDIPVGSITGLKRLYFALLMTCISPLKVILVDIPSELAYPVSEDLCSFYAALKAVSKDRLVICTTQNKDLAGRCADRIITLAGAAIAEDTCPYTADRKECTTPVKGAKKERQHGLGFARSFVLAAKGFKKHTAYAAFGIILAVLLVIIAGYGAAAASAIDANREQLKKAYADGAKTVMLCGSSVDRGWYNESVFQIPSYRVFRNTSTYLQDKQLETLAEYMPAMKMESGFSLTNYYADPEAEQDEYYSNPYVYLGADEISYLVELDPSTGTQDAYLAPATEDSRLPQDYTEIAITDYTADMLVRYGYRDWDSAYAEAEKDAEETGSDKKPEELISAEDVDTYEIASPEDLIGKTLDGLEIVGIFSTEEDLASFRDEYDEDGSAVYEEYRESAKDGHVFGAYLRNRLGDETYYWMQGKHIMTFAFVRTGYISYMDSAANAYAHSHPMLYQLQGSVSKDMSLIRKLTYRPSTGRKYYATVYTAYSRIAYRAQTPFPDEYMTIGYCLFAILEIAGMALCAAFMVKSMHARKGETDTLRAKGARQRDIAHICWCQALVFLAAEVLLALLAIGITCAVINAVYFIPLYSITIWSVLAVLGASMATTAVYTAIVSRHLANREVFNVPIPADVPEPQRNRLLS